ncbi:MAG: hypothetical protein P1V81_16215 [Planctomycetota bacterium]|nr:hypothetical protein [Planctomycetota bacterium]
MQAYPTTKTATKLAGWARGLVVVLVLALNLVLPVAGSTAAAPALLGPAGGCDATALQVESCCCAPVETSSCCDVVETVSCGCTTRRAPLPSEEHEGPTPLLVPTGDLASNLLAHLERSTKVVAFDSRDDVEAMAVIGTAPPPDRSTHPPALAGMAARLGLLRGNAARQAFLGTDLR